MTGHREENSFRTEDRSLWKRSQGEGEMTRVRGGEVRRDKGNRATRAGLTEG